MNKKRIIHLLNNNGASLVEVMVSIVMLSIIVGPFLTMFVQSTRSNMISKDVMEATYVAQGCMEEVYDLAQNSNFNDIVSTMQAREYRGQVVAVDQDYDFVKNIDGYFVEIEIRSSEYPNSDLVSILVKVFEDETCTRQQAQMENILSWKD